jgi:hypothetical protein
MRNEDGAILVDGQQVATTRQCCHCGAHFISIKGSGVDRGFCLGCMKITCGKKECDPHIPFEAKLDHAAGKRTSYTEAILELERQEKLSG